MKPQLKKPGKPYGPKFELVTQIIEATSQGKGYEVAGDFDRKSSASIRRLLNYHGQAQGLHFSVRQTQAGGLWIERTSAD